ncbi:MAG: hybrid sensor histidine kinase/response regulator [Sphingomonadaceae bacterium]
MYAGNLSPGMGGNSAVLYVDDEAMARKYFALAMANEYAVLTAPDMEHALPLLAAPGNGIGVLVTDYRMPGRGGAALLRHVSEHHPHVVCLLVTAYADKEVLLDSLDGAEVFRVLEKPLNMEHMRKALRLASERAREREARRDKLLAIEETLCFLAHELTTPLATINNFARGIERQQANLAPLRVEASQQAAGLIQDNVRYCLSVLNGFVSSVKLAHGAVTEVPLGSVHSAARLLRSLLDAYPLSPAQRALISCDVQQDFAVTAMPNCVALVLSSILGNALRALAEQPDAAMRFTLVGGDRPQIRLQDNGPGIPAAVQARLQSDPVSTPAASGGGGWGLIFCQRIMQSFGGSLSLQSVPGLSTTVILNFPAITQHTPPRGHRTIEKEAK